MNFKKIISLTITIFTTPYVMYPMVKKPSMTRNVGSSTANKLLTSGRSSIPLLKTGTSLTTRGSDTSNFDNIMDNKFQWNNALIPMTSDVYQANLIKQGIASPDIARSIGLERDINQKIVDLYQLNVGDQKWIDDQLKNLNKLYDKLIMSNLNSNETLLNIYTIQTDSESKLETFNKIKEKLIQNGLKTEVIDNYIEETKTIIFKAQRMNNQFTLDEPLNITKSSELASDFSSITMNSTSPNDFLNNINSFLKSFKYQKVKNKVYEQKARAEAQSNDPEYRYEKFYDQSNYEPYAGLNDQFKRIGRRAAFLTGLTTEEYMRRKQSAEQKSNQKAAERNDMRDFTRGR